jgi:hypothetical protein
MLQAGDDNGGHLAMILSPAMLRRTFKPRMAKFFAEAKRLDSNVWLA